MASTGATDSGKRRARRQIFNRPQWATPKTADEEQDIFTRGKREYVLDATKRGVKREKTTLRKSQEPIASIESGDEHQVKRRRTSIDRVDSDESEDDKPLLTKQPMPAAHEAATKEPSKFATPVQVASNTQLETPGPGCEEDSASALKTTSTAKDNAAKLTVIDVDSDDSSRESAEVEGEANKNEHAPTANIPPSPPEEEVLSSEEEFPELARKARELAQQRQQQRQSGANLPPSPPSARSHTFPPQDAAPSAGTSRPNPTHELPAPEAPVIRIQITSRIPNTKSLDALRRLDQRLGIARTAWCGHSGLSETDTAEVILVWRDVRVYNSASPRSLGLDVDADGDITRDGRKEEGSARRRLQMEAMTVASFENIQRQRKAREEADGEEEAREVERPKEKSKEPKVRLLIQSKGFPEVKVIMPTRTPMYRIARAFQIQNKIPRDREVHLLFDGERMDPETNIQDTDIADMDMIEAIVR